MCEQIKKTKVKCSVTKRGEAHQREECECRRRVQVERNADRVLMRDIEDRQCTESRPTDPGIVDNSK